MIINKSTGSLHLGDNVISPNLTQSRFRESMHDIIDNTRRTGDGGMEYNLKPISVDIFAIIAHVYFSHERLGAIQFNCFSGGYDYKIRSDANIYITKLLNDSVLRANLGTPHSIQDRGRFINEGENFYDLVYEFDWGRVWSYYDDRAGGMAIGITYQSR